MKVGVIGDTHAQYPFLKYAYEALIRKGAEEIWQVGDFGYWPRLEEGEFFLTRIARMVEEQGVPIYFADGNHEDHELLDQMPREPHAIKPNIFHVPRGVVLERGGKRVMFVGGAVSVDRKWRVAGRTWFANEVLSPHDIDFIKSQGEANIVVAHDAPTAVPYKLLSGWPPEDIRLADAHRALMTELAESIKPRLWLNGHYHQRVDHYYKGNGRAMKVKTLDCDTNWIPGKSYIVIETDDV